MTASRRFSMAVAILAASAGTATAFAPTRSIKITQHHANIAPMQSTSPATLAQPLSSSLSLSNTALQATATTGVSVDTAALTQFFLETLISYGVPAFFTLVIIAFTAKAIRGSKNKDDDMSDLTNGGLFSKSAVSDLYNDLYDEDPNGNKAPSNFLSMLSGKKPLTQPKNIGIPEKEFLTITNLNEKYSSYEYSLTKAIDSKSRAAKNLRETNFRRALQKSVVGGDGSSTSLSSGALTPAQKLDLLTEEKNFLKTGGTIMAKIVLLQRSITDLSIKEEMNKMEVDILELDPHFEDSNATTATSDGADASDEKKKEKKKSSSSSNKSELNKLMKDLASENTKLLKLELEFIRAIVEVLGPDRANGVRAALIGNIDGGGSEGLAGGLLKSLQERPLVSVLGTANEETAVVVSGEAKPDRNVFVCDFPGDVTASQVEFLREEVTAILRSAKPGDEALLVLQSGGGTVTGYGLAAAQLKRFKEKGLRLTICVEQVAASGGYMMCCTADRIVASPFAVLGSIGVIGEVPNFYERLKTEGIEFQTVTAGKFKRTLTPTKKVTKEDIAKQKDDLEGILRLFKAFVKENRPSLDIDDVATGETWFGDDALAKGLCDELSTVDDVLSQYVDEGCNVYEVKYDPFQGAGAGALGGLLPASEMTSTTNSKGGIIRGITRLFLNNVVPMVREEVMAELEGSSQMINTKNDITRRYMMKDDTAENIRVE